MAVAVVATAASGQHLIKGLSPSVSLSLAVLSFFSSFALAETEVEQLCRKKGRSKEREGPAANDDDSAVKRERERETDSHRRG